MAEPERTQNEDDLPAGMKPIPPEYYRGPGGCGFTGCTTFIVIVAFLALALLVIGLLTRQWMVPPINPRG
jgi:hypothetical protein